MYTWLALFACVGDSHLSRKTNLDFADETGLLTKSSESPKGSGRTDVLDLNDEDLPFLRLPTVSDMASVTTMVICIADFHNITEDSQYDYLQTALPEGIATRLSNVHTIRVVERALICDVLKELRLQATDLMNESTTCEIGNLVGSTHSILGSFECAGRLKLNVRLVENKTGKVICGFNKASVDRFYLEAVIAYDIARSLGSSLPSPPPEKEHTIESLVTKHREEADRLFYNGQYFDAYQRYCDASDANPLDIELHRCIEKCAQHGSLEMQLLERYRHLAHRNPTNAIFANFLGNAYLMIDPYDKERKAQNQYSRALSLDPSNSAPLNNLAIISYRNGDLDRAEVLFQEYTEQCPDDASGLLNLGILYVTKFTNDQTNVRARDRAEIILKNAIAQKPEMFLAHKTIARLHHAAGRKEEALRAYECSLILNRDQVDVWERVQRLRHELGISRPVTVSADDMQTRTIIRSKGLSELASHVVWSLKNQHFESAIANSKELCLQVPNNPFAYILLASGYEGIGDKQEAKKALHAAYLLLEKNR